MMNYWLNVRSLMVATDRSDEVAINRTLRRADWRFLLPDPRPARSVCFADGLLAQAVAAMSDQLIESTTHPIGECDLAVARNPDRQTLQAAWTALRLGGTCYVEWTSPLAGGPANMRQRLEAIGFMQVACYWPWPLPDRASPLYWLPLESPHVVRYLLANRVRGRGLLNRAGNKVLEVMWRLSLSLRLLAPLSVIARKPPVVDANVLDVIRTSWNNWSSEPLPQHLEWMLLTGGAKPINKVVGLVFAEPDRFPRLIVKLARVAESVAALDREAANLRAVQALRSDRVRGIPQVLFLQQWAGQTVLGETALTGRPLYTVLRRDTCRDLALKVTEWLAALAEHTTPCPRANWWERLIETTINEFERNFGRVIDPAKVQATRTILATLGDLPLVCEQRDCSPWNVLIADDDELVILDWESAEPHGLPLLDLIYFLTYLIFFLDGAMESKRFTESYRTMLDPATFTGRIVADCQQIYMDCMGLDPIVLRPLRLLTWLIHSRSEYQRFVAEGAGQPDPADLQRSLFVSLWEEELTHAVTTNDIHLGMQPRGSEIAQSLPTISEQNVIKVETGAGLPPSSLIVCSRNRARLLQETIESILNGIEVPDEIIIIDQSDKPDEKLAVLSTERRCEIRYQWAQPLGLSHARNLGIKIAQYDWLVFTDDDVLVTPDWCSMLLRALVDAGQRAVVTGRVLAVREHHNGGFAPSIKEDENPAMYEGRVGQDVLYSNNMALPKSAIAQIGDFDERLGPGTRFPSAEDSDLGFRLLEAGYRILYVPQAVLYHRAWRTDRDYLALRRSYGIGRGAFYAKHLHWHDRFMLRRMVQDIRNHLIQFVSRLRRDRLRAYGDVVLASGIFYGAVRWLLTQHRTQA
jgi:GT2 family glycosyltransferase